MWRCSTPTDGIGYSEPKLWEKAHSPMMPGKCVSEVFVNTTCRVSLKSKNNRYSGRKEEWIHWALHGGWLLRRWLPVCNGYSLAEKEECTVQHKRNG